MNKLKIVIMIIGLFLIPMIMSFLPERYSVAFGDWTCMGSGNEIYKQNGDFKRYERCNNFGNNYHEPAIHWGFRHIMFVILGVFLFAYNFFLLCIQIGKHHKLS